LYILSDKCENSQVEVFGLFFFSCVCVAVNKNGAEILTSQSPLKNTKSSEISVSHTIPVNVVCVAEILPPMI